MIRKFLNLALVTALTFTAAVDHFERFVWSALTATHFTVI